MLGKVTECRWTVNTVIMDLLKPVCIKLSPIPPSAHLHIEGEDTYDWSLFLFKESDTSQKRECKYNHPVQVMALKGTASGESSTDNILAYSSISGDATVCEQQFSRYHHILLFFHKLML